MPDQDLRYRFRGSIKPSAEVKRPVKAYRNADAGDANGSKSTSATIDIFDVIDSWGGWWGISAAEVDAALTDVGNIDTLYVRVNSPGGEATEGIAIANLLRAHAATIHVTVYGLAASAASYISTAGDSVAMAPGSMLMVHCAWNVVRGNAEDMRAEAGVLDKLDESIASLYALKAGGTGEDWLALMRVETWFTADDAVEAKLADKVGIDTSPLPANVEPAVPAEPDDDEATPFDRAARVFDLSVFAHPPAARAAHKPPADPPEHLHRKGADAMSDTEKTLRERLGLGDDADQATVDAKVIEKLDAAAQTDPPEITDDAIVAHVAKLDPEQAKALTAKLGKTDEPVVPEGKVLVDAAQWDDVKEQAKLGAAARAQQLTDERDTVIAQAFSDGKLKGSKLADKLKADWDADVKAHGNADLTRQRIADMAVLYPVGQPTGYAGSDGSDGDGTKPFTDDEADALAALSGTTKEALLNG